MSALKNLMIDLGKFDEFSTLHDRLCFLDKINRITDFKIFTVDPATAMRSKGNFYSLLYQVGIPANLYLFTLYLNGFSSPYDYDGKKMEFKLGHQPDIPAD